MLNRHTCLAAMVVLDPVAAVFVILVGAFTSSTRIALNAKMHFPNPQKPT